MSTQKYTFRKDPTSVALNEAIRLLGKDDPKALPAAAKALNMAYRTLMRKRGEVTINIQFDQNGARDVIYQSGTDPVQQHVDCGYLPGFGQFRGNSLNVTVPTGCLHEHLTTLLLDFDPQD